jgi:hypothetical protein
MTQRKATLKRLAHLYEIVETASRAEAQRAILQLAEVEQVIALHNAIRDASKVAGRSALERDDRMEWMMAGAQVALTEWNSAKLIPIQQLRFETKATAMQQYATSRMESEQMKQLLDDATKHKETVQRRKMQAHADDRFLSRRRWVETAKAKFSGALEDNMSGL